MQSTPEPSLEELREESERSRDALASTVTELREKVGDTATELKTLMSPAHIKQEIRTYVREERESLTQSLKRRAQDNPLQMAAVGAAIVYPAWSLFRAIPAPLLLIGAGLFLTSKRGQQSAKELKAKADDALQEGADKMADLAGILRSDFEDRIAGARYGAEELQDTVTSAAGLVAEKMRASFHDASGTAKTAVGAATDKAAQAIDSVTVATGETLGHVKDRATSAAMTSRDGMMSFVNDNALLVASIGAAVGAFLAASIPASQAENRLFGAGSQKLKDKAREAAAQGIEKASDIAAEAAGSVAAAAAREGLDASGVQRALNTVADSVRAVTDRGVDAALGAQGQSQHPVSERNAI